MLDSLLASLTRDGSLAIAALLAGNVAQAIALLKSWSWHRKDRQEDRERWIAEVSSSNRQLAGLVEAVTQLRLMIAQCTSLSANRRRS